MSITPEKTYNELFLLLEKQLGLGRKYVEKVVRGERKLTNEEIQMWTQAAVAFNREASEAVKTKAKNTDGFKIILLDSVSQNNISIVKKALLYTDLIVVYSSPFNDISLSESAIEDVKRGGLICAGIPQWYRDLFHLKLLLLSGYGLCVQKNYYDMQPEIKSGRWVLADFANERLKKNKEEQPISVNPLSLYFDLISPSSFDCTSSGTDFSEWKNKVISTFKSVNDSSFGTLLNVDMPYLENIPLDILVKIREDEDEAFKNFRGALKSAVQECLKFDAGSESIENLARHVQKTYIEPEVNDVRKKLSATTKMKTVRAFAPVITTVSLAFNVLIGNPIGLLIDTLRTAQWGFQEFLQRKQEKSGEKKTKCIFYGS